MSFITTRFYNFDHSIAILTSHMFSTLWPLSWVVENGKLHSQTGDGNMGHYWRHSTPAEKLAWCTLSWRYYPWPSANIWEVEVFIFFLVVNTFFLSGLSVLEIQLWDSSSNFHAAKFETLDGKLFFSYFIFWLYFPTNCTLHYHKDTSLFLYVLVCRMPNRNPISLLLHEMY